MSSEWRTYRLHDAGRIVTGKTPKGGVPEYEGGDVPFVSPTDFSGSKWINHTDRHISEIGANSVKGSVIPSRSVLVTCIGSDMGKAALSASRCVANQQINAVLVDESRFCPEFLYYSLSLRKNEIRSLAGGSAQPILNKSAFGQIEFDSPSLEDQKRVSATVRPLDDRITLLRETNATLEAIAQALFKSWFVDFDPVRAKMEGRAPEGMDEATAAMFPDRLEASELGEVPRGWGYQSIRQAVGSVFDGPHATPPEASDGGIFLGIKNLTGTALDLTEIRHIADGDWAQWTKRVTPRQGDIVFSYEATLGFFALIPPGVRCCLGRRLALVRPHEADGTPHFWHHQFTAPPFQQLLEKHTIQGATVNRIALKSFPDLMVLVPSVELRRRFDGVAAPIWSRIHENQAQARALVGLRDTLLPRLISGQLQLQEAEANLSTEATV